MNGTQLRRFVAAIAAIAAILTSNGAAIAAPRDEVVSAQDNLFQPANLTIAAGTTVIWRNDGANPHTSTSDQGLWDSGTLGPGASFAYTFNTPGRYSYNCRFHRGAGMTGVLEVRTAGMTPPAAATALPPPAALGRPPAAMTYPGPGYGAPAVRYVVRHGDTLFGIARRFGVPIRALLDANRIWNPNLIYVGQVLVVPAMAPPQPPACLWYRVQRGDNVFRLALRFGTTVRAIAEINGIHPDRIFVGQSLLICPQGQRP